MERYVIIEKIKAGIVRRVLEQTVSVVVCSSCGSQNGEHELRVTTRVFEMLL